MIGMRAAVGVAAVLAVAGMAVSGCSDDDASGAAAATVAAEPWNCETLSGAALRQATLDPATLGPGSFGPGQPGWKTCEWDGKDFGVIVSASATTTSDHFRNHPMFTGAQDVTVAGRPAFTVLHDGDKRAQYCDLVVPFESGGVMSMQVSRSPFTKDRTPMCEWAVRIGEVLVPEMPR